MQLCSPRSIRALSRTERDVPVRARRRPSPGKRSSGVSLGRPHTSVISLRSVGDRSRSRPRCSQLSFETLKKKKKNAWQPPPPRSPLEAMRDFSSSPGSPMTSTSGGAVSPSIPSSSATQEEFYGKQLIIADRELVEQGCDDMLEAAVKEDVAFLVVGDPLGATTHSDLMLRAHERGVKTQVVHNASILTAVGCCGLQLYNFGETVSIVMWTDTWQPHSYYDKIAANRKRGLHTLCLLDIKMKEKTVENLIKGRDIYEPPRFMTAAEAAAQLLEIIKDKQHEGTPASELAYNEDTACVGLARIGTETQHIVCSSLRDMSGCDLGSPLHSLVIPGKLHPMEAKMLALFVTDTSWFSASVRKDEADVCP